MTFLNDYSLKCTQMMAAAVTLTGGDLVRRHWQEANGDELSCSARWGHRIVGVIEAIPVLGGLVSLVEAAIHFCLQRLSSNKGEGKPHSYQESLPQEEGKPHSHQESLLQEEGRPHSYQESLLQEEGRPHSHQESLLQEEGRPHSYQESLLQEEGRPHSHQESLLQEEGKPHSHQETSAAERFRMVLGDKRYSLTLHPNPPLPTKHARIDEAKAEEWISAHLKYLRPLARKFVENITYISFDEFMQALEESVNSFNDWLNSMPEDQRDYVIVVPEANGEKSNRWVTRLGIPFLERRPFNIIDWNDFREFMTRNPQINNYVFFDDGAFSGVQMESHTRWIRETKSVFLIIPYMTNIAHSTLSGPNCSIGKWNCINTVKELYEGEFFTRPDFLALEWDDHSRLNRNRSNRCPFYFQHKKPDALSSCESELKYGHVLDGSGRRIPFIPDIRPPYKSIV